MNKFRCFDTRNNEMVYSDGNGDGCFYVNTKGVLFMYAIPKSESGIETIYHKSYDVDQFTGLKDKNGVDIYEGDIVEEMRLLHDGPCFKNVAVKYVAPSFRVGELSLCNYAGIEWRVVGNIHENPELLK